MTDAEKVAALETLIEEMNGFWRNTVSARVTPKARDAFGKNLWGALKICAVSETTGNGWIKVTPDTMPPNMQEVIVTFENEKKERCVQLQARWNGEQRYWEFLGYDWEEAGEPYYKVTHWMPTLKPAED